MKQKYLTSRQLKITPVERKYLIKFVQVSKSVRGKYQGHKFAMNHFYTKISNINSSDLHQIFGEEGFHGCGSVGCIAGTMQWLDKKKELPRSCGVYDADKASEVLKQLFYPDNTLDYSTITVQMAVETTERFLKTGVIDHERSMKKFEHCVK